MDCRSCWSIEDCEDSQFGRSSLAQERLEFKNVAYCRGKMKIRLLNNPGGIMSTITAGFDLFETTGDAYFALPSGFSVPADFFHKSSAGTEKPLGSAKYASPVV